MNVKLFNLMQIIIISCIEKCFCLDYVIEKVEHLV